MNHIARFAPGLVIALLAFPTSTLAQYSIYTDSNGNFRIAFGRGAAGGGVGAFACGSNNICQIASTILFIINNVLVPVLFAIAFIVFLWGIFKSYIWNRGEDAETGHKYVLWGVIGFVVMISLWGLVNVVANTFGLNGAGAPPTPSSVSPYQ